MKKRKELDALLGNRASYEPIQNAARGMKGSFSSREANSFFHRAADTTMIRKKSGRSIHVRERGCTPKNIFYICLPVCVFALIAACITSSIGIVWMQMQLKSDMDSIKDRIFKLERLWNDDAAALVDVQHALSKLDNKETDIKEGKNGLRSLNAKLAFLSTQFDNLPPIEMTTPKADIDKLEKKISDMLSDMSVLRSERGEYTATLMQLTANYAALNQAVDEVRATTQSLNKEIQNISSINASVCQLREEVAQLSSRADQPSTNGGEEVPAAGTGESKINIGIQKPDGSEKARVDESDSVKNTNGIPSEIKLLDAQTSIERTAENRDAGPDREINQRLREGQVPDDLLTKPLDDVERPSSVASKQTALEEGLSNRPSPDVAEGRAAPFDKKSDVIVTPSKNTNGHRVGDTTTSFTQLPVDRRHGDVSR